MRTDFYYESQCGSQIHGCRWMPAGELRAIVQIVHGISEHVERYDGFAENLNQQGILVVAEDHMGHGKSISEDVPRGYFAGGWFGAVEDTCRLMRSTMEEFPGVPYILFGHSMGSFMARTILAKYPDSGIAGAIICGTGWMPEAVVQAGKLAATVICRQRGERTPSGLLRKIMFSGYNKRVEHPRTRVDWLTRDKDVVDRYVSDPASGFAPASGLVRDMMTGILYIQTEENLDNMRKDLPVYFIAGGDDPVGNYGVGVRQAAEAFKKHGMERVSLRLWPLCRHEILNEINREEIFEDVKNWIAKVI